MITNQSHQFWTDLDDALSDALSGCNLGQLAMLQVVIDVLLDSVNDSILSQHDVDDVLMMIGSIVQDHQIGRNLDA